MTDNKHIKKYLKANREKRVEVGRGEGLRESTSKENKTNPRCWFNKTDWSTGVTNAEITSLIPKSFKLSERKGHKHVDKLSIVLLLQFCIYLSTVLVRWNPSMH